MPRRTRGLSPDERDLWQRVASSARALHPEPARKVDKSAPPAPKKSRTPMPDFRLGERAPSVQATHDLVPDVSERLARQAVRMDRRTHQKMTRGSLSPEARIDLHGMTLAEAHPQLIRFVLSAQAQGKRLVLVITGKGKMADDGGPIPARVGVLRHQVPHWLSMAPLGPLVLQISPAHVRHGGHGAYYVYLRKTR